MNIALFPFTGTLIGISSPCDASNGATSLPPHETDGCRPPFSRVGINVDHEKKVDLGVLRDAECHWLGEQKPISTV